MRGPRSRPAALGVTFLTVVLLAGCSGFVARSAYRHYEDPPTYGDKHIGFRVASQ